MLKNYIVNNRFNIACVFSILLTITGIYFLISSVDLANARTNKYFDDSGLDMSSYLAMLHGYHQSYMVLGGILLFVGISLFVHTLFFKKEKE
ncbi:hypothetical protein COJ48_24755 [Bacillus cereus]|nr:hypothetical protein COJ48_24755 [Bacillus cereus]